jgi:protease secretion system outer membrane protein
MSFPAHARTQLEHRQALSLSQAIQAAFQKDPEYQVALAARDAGIEGENIGRAGLLPSLSMNYSMFPGSTTYIRSSTGSQGTTPWTRNDYDSSTRSLTLRQPLFRARNWATFLQGRSEADQAEARLRFARFGVITRIVAAYGDWLFIERKLQAARASAVFHEARSQQVRALRLAGHAALTDELQAEANHQKALREIADLERDFAYIDERFQHLIGTSARPLMVDAAFRNLKEDDLPGIDQLRKTAVAQNPELAALRIAIEVAKFEIQKNRADHLPTIDFVANYVRDDNASATALGRETKTSTAGFQFTVPIYQGGAVDSATRRALANFRRAEAELLVAEQRILNDLAKAHAALTAALKMHLQATRQLRFAQQNLLSTDDQLKLGYKNQVDRLQAQHVVATAMADGVEAISTWMIAQSMILALTGELDKIEGRESEFLLGQP